MKDYLHRDYRSQASLQEKLTALPALSQTPGYQVIEGNPMAEMRLDVGEHNSSHRVGIWRCTPGSFRCTEKGNELQTILDGSMSLVDENGQTHDYGPGDSFYTMKGQRVIWQIRETVTKVFFTYDSDGADEVA